MAKFSIPFVLPYKRILMMGDEGVVLYAQKGRSFEVECSLPWMMPDFDQQLLGVLESQNQQHPVMILYDAVEQYYRKETLPKVGAGNKSKVLKNRLNMAFQNYPVRSAVELIPLPENKKQHKSTPSYLFVALPESEQLGKLYTLLFRAGVPIAGLAMLPIESADMVISLKQAFQGDGKKKAKREDNTGWSVLIGQHQSGGMRQIVVRDGNLALTRLTPMPDGNVTPEAYAQEVLREFKASLSYISRLGYKATDGLDVFVICDGQQKQILSKAEVPVSNFRCLTIDEAAKKLSLKVGPQEEKQYADVLHAAWAASKMSLEMGVKVEKLSKVALPRLVTRIISILLMVASLGFVGMNALSINDYLATDDEIVAKEGLQRNLKAEYEEEAKVFEQLPYKPEVIRGAISAKQLLEKNAIRVQPILSRVKKALGKDLVLDNFKLSHEPDTSKISFEAYQAGERKKATRKAAGFRAFKKNISATGNFTLTFDISMEEERDLEKKVVALEQLAQRLQNEFKGKEVTILEQFGGASRTGRMEGRAGGSSSDASSSGSDTASIEIKGAPEWSN